MAQCLHEPMLTLWKLVSTLQESMAFPFQSKPESVSESKPSVQLALAQPAPSAIGSSRCCLRFNYNSIAARGVGGVTTGIAYKKTGIAAMRKIPLGAMLDGRERYKGQISIPFTTEICNLK